MATWVTQELREIVESRFPVRGDARGIFGHSMGGHGALVLALRHPELYRSVSAFAPIVAPSAVPWGIKAFSRYLGDDRAAWAQWDACELLRTRRFVGTPLVDQGTADKFLDRELQPHRLQARCDEVDQPLVLRMHEGYDHSYFSIATFVEDHLCHHAAQLGIA